MVVRTAPGVLGRESERDAPLSVHGDSGQRVPASRRRLEVQLLTGQSTVNGGGFLGAAVGSDEKVHGRALRGWGGEPGDGDIAGAGRALGRGKQRHHSEAEQAGASGSLQYGLSSHRRQR